jgi:spore coat protein U-like protein
MSKQRLFLAVATASLVSVLSAAAASAATTTATFTVNATVAATCNVAANALNFGSYSGAQLAANTTVQATCTNTTPYTLALDQGVSTGATVTSRKMIGTVGSDLLGYGLFRDSAHTQNWGNTAGTDTVASSGTGAVQSFTVYGLIPANELVQPTTYQDTITVTLAF